MSFESDFERYCYEKRSSCICGLFLCWVFCKWTLEMKKQHKESIKGIFAIFKREKKKPMQRLYDIIKGFLLWFAPVRTPLENFPDLKTFNNMRELCQKQLWWKMTAIKGKYDGSDEWWVYIIQVYLFPRYYLLEI